MGALCAGEAVCRARKKAACSDWRTRQPPFAERLVLSRRINLDPLYPNPMFSDVDVNGALLNE